MKWWSCGKGSNKIHTHEHPAEASMNSCLWGLCSQYKDRKYRTTLSIGSSCRKQMLMVWRDTQCYPLTLTTRKQCNKEMVSNRIKDYIHITQISGKISIIVTFHISTSHYNTYQIRGCINITCVQWHGGKEFIWNTIKTVIYMSWRKES